MRSQLRLSLAVLAALAFTLGLVPLILHLVPAVGRVVVLGVPVPWVILTVVAFIEIVLLGVFYVRRAGAQRGRSQRPAGQPVSRSEPEVSASTAASPSSSRRRRVTRGRRLRPADLPDDERLLRRLSRRRSGAQRVGDQREYSAASFLGVAGLILARGVDMLWLPVGWTAGYLLLLVFVAAPLRRSGAYTLPDFAQLRVESTPGEARRQPARRRHRHALPHPAVPGRGAHPAHAHRCAALVGQVVVAVIVSSTSCQGMRSVTLVQAFHYWLKLVALLTPVFFLVGATMTAVPQRRSVAWTRSTGPTAHR